VANSGTSTNIPHTISKSVPVVLPAVAEMLKLLHNSKGEYSEGHKNEE
jgi:hypothetical protein